MESRDSDDDGDGGCHSFSDHELVVHSNAYAYPTSSTSHSSCSMSEDRQSRRSFSLKSKRSQSLTHFELNEYSIGEIRRMHERLAARTPGAFKISKSSFRDFNRSQVLALICLCFNDFIGFCSMSILAPFFPKEAAQKEMSQTTSGLVFSFYAFIIFIASPIVGKTIPKLGARFVLSSGLFIAGGCSLLFGVLDYIKEPWLFATFCFIVRGLEALGAAAYSTASYVFVVEMFPSNVGAVLGVMEIFVGLGMSTGPAIGGLLYSVGGFGLPFYALGFVLMLAVPVTLCLLPAISGSNRSRKSGISLLDLLKNPIVLLVTSVIIAVSICWSFLDPTLEPHLRQFSLTPGMIGLIFLLFSGVYGISSPLWGWISDRCEGPWLMMSVGLLFSAVSLLLLGPSPILFFLPSATWLHILSLCMLGASVALGLLPTFQGLLDGAMDRGCGDDLTTYSLVAGAWSSMYALGEVIGPLAGGAITERFGFPVCCTVVAILCATIGIVCAVCWCILPKNSNSRTTSSTTTDDDNSEAHPLLSDSKDW